MEPPAEPTPLIVKDCALLAIATGERAQNLKELRDRLLTIHAGCLYNHFWGGLLHPRFEEREYNNDFAAWARHALHDKMLAERLSVVDPGGAGPEDLRAELVEIIEERLDEREVLSFVQPDQQFEFIRAQTLVFETGRRLHTPEQLAVEIGRLSVGSVFYHFIDAQRRNANRADDFRNWLDGFGAAYAPLCRCLAAIDPYFTSLTDLRRGLAETFEWCLREVEHG
jgi:hypothetical protein